MSYRTDSAEFPWLHHAETDGKPFKFMMTNERSVGWYKGAENSEYLDLITPGIRAIDVGANEGYIAIQAAVRGAAVIAIEPAAHNIQPLTINVALNGLEDRVRIIHAAAGNDHAELPFTGEIVGIETEGKETPVRTVMLDDFISYQPGIVKIDAEGYEVKILQGAIELLRECTPVIFLEIHLHGPPTDISRFGNTVEELIALVEELKYVIFKNNEATTTLESGAYVLRPITPKPKRKIKVLPPGFCIILDETTERTEAAKEHFSKSGVTDVAFVGGFNGRKMGLDTEIWSGEVANGVPCYNSPGQIGLCLSHRMLWRMIWEKGLPEALILEDDAIFCEHFLERFPHFYADVPDDWQLIFPGPYDIGPETWTQITDRVVVDLPYRTHAYLIRRSAIPILLEETNTVRNHIDVLLRRCLPKLKAYCFATSLVKQRTAEGEWETTAF